MKTDHVLITVPAEGPEIPEGWTFHGYAVVDEDFNQKWPRGSWEKATDLKSAGYFYAGHGEDTHSIIARCEYCTEEGCYEIYSVFRSKENRKDWAGDLYEWSSWFNWNDEAYKPFDFEKWKKEIA